VPAIILLLKLVQQEVSGLGLDLKWGVYVLPYTVFVSTIIDVYLYGHLSIFSVLSLILAFTILNLLKRDLEVALAMVATLAMIISVLYIIYVPSFGNDTWRDVMQAKQIVERGGLRDLTIFHASYPFPLVSLLYALYSVVTNVNTVWSSNVIGILYLVLLILWIHMLSEKLNIEYHRTANLLALTTPLVIVWSVGFVPQAYALLMILPFLFLKLHLLIAVVLIVALVFGHAGMALWTLSILLILTIFAKIFDIEASIYDTLQQFSTKLILLAIAFSIYTLYSIILMVLKGAVTSIFEAIIAFFSGEKIMVAATPIQIPVTSILGIIPMVILAVLALVRMLEDRDNVLRLFAFISLAGLTVAYVGAVAFPALDLPRYLGLGSVTLLAILSPQAFQSLASRGRIGIGYAYALLLLAVFSFGFAGTLMPNNTYTANPYSIWSISGLITYSEELELENIAFKLCCNNYLLDWRTGAYLGYKYLWIQPLSRGFYNPETQSFFIYAGSYGLLVTSEYFTNFKGILIFRQSSLNMPEAYSPRIDTFLNTITDKVSILYMSSQIRVILFK
jgi:uncharacterized membrane protein